MKVSGQTDFGFESSIQFYIFEHGSTLILTSPITSQSPPKSPKAPKCFPKVRKFPRSQSSQRAWVLGPSPGNALRGAGLPGTEEDNWGEEEVFVEILATTLASGRKVQRPPGSEGWQLPMTPPKALPRYATVCPPPSRRASSFARGSPTRATAPALRPSTRSSRPRGPSST